MLGLASALGAGAAGAAGSPSAARLADAQVTATRFGDRVQEVPHSMRVVTGDEIRARGAIDLRTALALLGGVSVAPGGDPGPAAGTPNLLGVREIDDLLLLIDGIPAGGAFVPQTEAVSLVNVERIEVLRGAAPVYFGTTAFAGTVNVIHYPAGEAESTIELRYGSRGSVAASGSAVLSTGAIRQSISAALSDDRTSDPRAGYRRAQGGWRLATDLAGGGTLRADLNLLSLRQKPDSPSPIDTATGQLITTLPKDFNQNPADARLDTDRWQLVLGAEVPLGFGRWGSTLAYTRSHVDSVRGFIDSEDTPQPWTAQTRADVEANAQQRRLQDLFVDTHLSGRPMADLDLTAGVNLLLGRASVTSLRYAHTLLLDGASSLPDIASVPPKTDVDLEDRRRFFGAYLQGRYRLSADASLLAGARWNSTHESRGERRTTLRTGVVAMTDAEQDARRFSGSVGAQWKVFQSSRGGLDAVTLHASVGNTFQPAQIDFNPNPEVKGEGGALLKPETQRSLVAGIRANAWGGTAEVELEGFFVDFDNQPVQGTGSTGKPALLPAGRQRYKGLDLEGTLRPIDGWLMKANLTWSDARYRDFVTDIDGTPTQLAGKHQLLTPRLRAGAGLLFAPERGWRGSVTASYSGSHWLDRQNTARASGYAVVDASLGYRFERCTVQLAAANIGNRRDAVQQSELGEDQFYRLPARRFDLTLNVPIR
jgi:iron complex outermembrane recepter protein